MKSIYRVMMLKNGKWELWTVYAEYEEAEIAGCGLITGGHATQVHILEIGANGGQIVAQVSSVPKIGYPHGDAAVKKL
jgi:hypothetical protein